MQDTSTGEMMPLNPKFFEGIATKSPFDQRQAMQAAMDEALPDRTKQGAVFVKGEIIEIRGSKFRVNGITRKRIYLDSIPS